MKRDDALWKGLIEDLSDDFLKFFFPNAEEVFDFNRKISFLDKELEQIFPNNPDEFSPKYVDKLIKVYRKSGKDEWVLVHIEVQGSTDKVFEKRMFQYYYRILDKYDRDVTSLAILTDKNKSFHPSTYKKEFIGSSVEFKFNVYKVLDADEKELEMSDNPFASVMLVVLIALKKGKISEKSLFDLKMQLLRKLYAKKFSKERITALLRFLKLYVRFESKELIDKFDIELDKITNRPNTMGLKEFVLDRERRMARKEGRETGLKEGREEGRETGLQEGREEGMSIKEKEEKTKFTVNLLTQTDFSDEKIALLVGIDIEFVKETRALLS
ncbi:hypothetical protein VB796_09635 [Arcicella sp. LKC2W]|uniref:hypothetical protein n=1 Tax=Arcicella sp. LKC2W TaxID=2984198 RepID=UPI002B1FAA06|nr:hypothetical protein [Arcicella sp. LKC2W]MEA5459299.1 hypothetical protein [Arcicella sp. LKC2W]